MAATFMEFYKLGVFKMDFSQWSHLKQKLCQKFNTKLKFLEEKDKNFEQFSVL